ncbi:hypothetical protein ACFPT7_23585 [Acidicapsa dinghuensis]|uniref:Glycosyltransferase subfamily 4-like N-terminal domain-containing protein n=1 Tax=Acidicapsa dinghuensis TaxID=2218256 RepID=A0ABW1EMM1_9BACT|nr:hypothetical protein [Acidicapsa dinghuensis]
MTQVKVALFTPFSPTTGGGGVIFRSILPHLKNAEIHWFYLAASPVDTPSSTLLGPRMMGGSLGNDAVNTLRLFALQSHPQIDRYVQAIRAWSPDIVWVNAMNEGILVGKKLLDSGIPHLHVSVHDDPAGLAIKSARYRAFASLMDRRNTELLRRAHTVDTVCDSMSDYYKRRIGVDSGVVYRYIHNLQLPAPQAAKADTGDGRTIHIGHVGSAYSSEEVFAFLRALQAISASDGIQFRLTNYGVSPAMAAAQQQFPDIVENAGNTPEDEVIRRLQRTAFVYSMYSFNPRHRIFRQTSQPTKMSTYLMAVKPILAHCPSGSSTINMLSKFKLGHCVTSTEISFIADAIRYILKFQLDGDEARRAAEYYCGRRNLDYLNTCFGLPSE